MRHRYSMFIFLLVLSGCSSTNNINYANYESGNSGTVWEYKHASKGAFANWISFSKNNIVDSEKELSAAASDGWMPVYNSDPKHRNIVLKRNQKVVPSEFKIVTECELTESVLDSYGVQGYELDTLRFHWSQTCGFIRPKSETKRTDWKYKVLNSCHPNKMLPEINRLATQGWELIANAGKFASMDSWCILKKSAPTKTFTVKILDACTVDDLESFNRLGKSGWELTGKYYNWGHYCILQRAGR